MFMILTKTTPFKLEKYSVYGFGKRAHFRVSIIQVHQKIRNFIKDYYSVE